MKMKRIVSILLAVTMLLSVAPMSFAANYNTLENAIPVTPGVEINIPVKSYTNYWFSIESARLYNADAKLVDSSLVFGSVSRDCVWYTLKSADTVEGQGVRAEVYMSGTQQPCGGNFALTYDADVLCAIFNYEKHVQKA